VDLEDILSRLPKLSSPELLVGPESFDDAGVFRLSEELALVLTVDIITPVSDDPRAFGRVAAANSLSDVFAMGGEVKAGLNLCCFPEDLPKEDALGILLGASDALREAGGVLAGGHSVEDEDLKFGLSVTGVIDPRRILRNGGGKPGEVLVLTKPLGTGVGVSAIKMQLTTPAEHDELIANMGQLNLAASRAALAADVWGATDVTGFGLVGHALEMARGAGQRLIFHWEELPIYGWFERLWEAGARTKVTATNHELVRSQLTVPEALRPVDIDLLCDPQTSGGLLLSVPKAEVDGLLERLRSDGVLGVIVGETAEGEPGVEVR